MKKYSIFIEMVTAVAAVAFLIYELRSMLLFGETTLIHDNIHWAYPIFHFFAENIINGHFPFWDPFNFAGEPFYPLVMQVRLLEPITLLTIYLGQFISNDIVMLFNWNHFIKSLVISFGVYLVFRSFSEHPFIRLSLIPILLYSSFILVSFRQVGILDQFLWIPYITYFLLCIVYYRDYSWHNWFMLAVLIGLNWQSYIFVATWIFLLFFSFGIVFFRRDLLTELFKSRMIVSKIMVMAFVIFVMAIPNIILLLEKDNYMFPTRFAENGQQAAHEIIPSSAMVSDIKMPYSFVASTGGFSSIWDFIQIISPDGNKFNNWAGRTAWGNPTEAYIYLGFLPWAIALLGLVAGRHDLKRVWLLIFISFGLLMIGPPGGLHRVLYYIYPPIWFIRHTQNLVLFFVFALLYFYVLGFNHIFYSWGSQLFSSNSFQGILDYLINRTSRFKKVLDAIQKLKEQCISALKVENNERNIFRLQGEIKALESVVTMPELRVVEADYYGKGIAILIFSACIATSVYLMTKLTYPTTNYLFVFIIIIAAIGWLLRKDLVSSGLYVSLIASHILIVFIFSANPFKFTRYIIPALVLPGALFIFIKPRENFFSDFKLYAPIILLTIFSISLISDLVYSFRKSSYLYQSVKHFGNALNANTTPQKPFLPQNRLIAAPQFVSTTGQSMRYLPLVYHQPHAFSSIMWGDIDYTLQDIPKTIFNDIKNGSFETWAVSKDGSFLPYQFTYHQDGYGGSVERYTGNDYVKDGKTAIFLRPSSKGNSYIRYQTSNIAGAVGHYIIVSVWVKSQNKTPDAIQLYVQNNSAIIENQSYYRNSGEWENIYFAMPIKEKSSFLNVIFNIKSNATAGVFFDKVKIDILKISTDPFEFALKARRWNSFLLPKKYYELIHADIPPLVIKEMFAVGKAMFQFKQKVIQLKEDEIPYFFKQLGDKKSVELLQKAVILDERSDLSLSKPKQLPEEFQMIDQMVSDIKKEENFTYVIERYNHNSLDMKVFANNEGILYWADGYDKAWHAYINDKEVPIYRANINFKAISLPKGANNIKFVYDPPFKKALFAFYSAFIVCSLAAVGISIFSRRTL